MYDIYLYPYLRPPPNRTSKDGFLGGRGFGALDSLYAGATPATDPTGTATGTATDPTGTGAGPTDASTFDGGVELNCDESCRVFSNFVSNFSSCLEKNGIFLTLSKSLNDSFNSFQYASIVFGISASEIADFGYVKG